jgi:hypothetical protein
MRVWELQRAAVAAVFVSAGAALVVGCGGTSKVSSASLDSRLAPVSVAPGFHLERTLDWSNPVNLVGEGFRLPEATHPSQGVSEVNGSGFEGSAGEQLNVGGPTGQTITTGVVRFSSPANATKVRDWMHKQDLQQPCFAQCVFSPVNLPAPAIPGAVAVRQLPSGFPGPPAAVRRAAARAGHPIRVPPPGGPGGPPTNYLAEFTIGKYLYFAQTSGTGTSAQFLRGLSAYYSDVSKLSSS